MKIAEYYSHLNGYEWLMYKKPQLFSEIKEVINSIDPSVHKTKKSEEKTMKGRMLYNPSSINSFMKEQFNDLGWNKQQYYYWLTDDVDLIRTTLSYKGKDQRRIIEEAGNEAIRSYNEIDFIKDRVAIEVQFGKYSFIAYDLFVKHMSFFIGDEIDLGIEILPMKEMQKEMSSGPGYYEKALYDLVRQGRGVPAVPLILIGIVP